MFKELELEEELLNAVEELGFETPTPVQEKVIPHLLQTEFQDLIALAQTGTGKTAAFGLPLIQKTQPQLKKIQHLILSPTRELCLQIADDLSLFSKYKNEIKIGAIFGGASIDRQIKMIKEGVHIISATPGRLADLIHRKVINLSEIKILVLDEADEMLNMGFRDELEEILSHTPEDKNTLLFSATMSNEVRAIANKYMNNPVEIIIGKKNSGAENVNHICYTVHSKDRYLALKRIVDYHPEIYGIVFCKTKKETQEIADNLIRDGYNADALHGDLSQPQRDVVMNKFRIKHLKLLVATDVAARGLDVDDLTHIINFNLPDELDLYLHRSGRTGRAGKNGTSIVIASLKEKGKLKQIEKQINKSFTFNSIPRGDKICERQLFYLIDRMEKVEVDYSQIDPLLPVIFKKLEWLDREELIKKFVSVEFNRFLDYYKNAVDLSSPAESKKSGGERKRNAGFTRFFINLGKKENLQPRSLISLINDFTRTDDIEIGDIEIMNNFSFFEIDKNYTEELLNAFSGKEYKKRKIILEVAESKGTSKSKGIKRQKQNKEDFYTEKKNRKKEFSFNKKISEENFSRKKKYDKKRKRRNR